MGLYYRSTIYYGVSLKSETFSEMLSLATREIYGNRKVEYNPDSDSLTNIIDRNWAQNGDPVRIFNDIEGYSGESYPCLCIRNTLHVTDSIRCGYNETTFQLEDIDCSEWERLIKATCEKYQFPSEKPAFRVTIHVPDDFADAGFYYGMYISEEDFFKSTLLKESNLSREDRKYMDHGEFMRVIDENWSEKGIYIDILYGWEFPDLYFLVIGGTKGSIDTRDIFEIAGFDTKPWDQLLRAKCETYGIQKIKPSFHLKLFIG